MRWSVASVIFFALAAAFEESSCPCIASSDRSESVPTCDHGRRYQQHLLCIWKSELVEDLFASSNPESLNLNYRVVDENKRYLSGSTSSDVLIGCSVVLEIVEDHSKEVGVSEMCPGTCKDLPTITIPIGFLQPSQNQARSTFRTCSLNLQVSYPVRQFTYLPFTDFPIKHHVWMIPNTKHHKLLQR